jgi:hypothetical protein
MVGTIAAEVPECDMPWQHKQEPHEMTEKLPLGLLEIGERSQYTVAEPHALSSWTGKLGNFT